MHILISKDDKRTLDTMNEETKRVEILLKKKKREIEQTLAPFQNGYEAVRLAEHNKRLSLIIKSLAPDLTDSDLQNCTFEGSEEEPNGPVDESR